MQALLNLLNLPLCLMVSWVQFWSWALIGSVSTHRQNQQLDLETVNRLPVPERSR